MNGKENFDYETSVSMVPENPAQYGAKKEE